MHIGFDIDGVISRRDPTRISLNFVRFLLYIGKNFSPKLVHKWTMSQPLQDDIHLARKVAQSNKISIITARPKFMKNYTEDWLRNVAKIEYDSLYCVGLNPGFGKRKLEIAQKIGLDMFLDDTESTVETFEKAGMQAQIFRKWSEVKITYKLTSD